MAAPRLSILAFGVSSFAMGLITLANPESQAVQLDLPAGASNSINGNGLAAIAMGIYYTLGAYQNNIPFFIATVPMRLLTTFVFWRQNWTLPAFWEGGGALLTAGTLLWGWSRNSLGKKEKNV